MPRLHKNQGVVPTPEGLGGRYNEILTLLIGDFIAKAQAVGSRQLSRKTKQRLSAATIRNVMSDLEEMGYLFQPHTSAGRIPTTKGLRYYVDTLIEKRSLSPNEKEAIENHFPVRRKDIPSLMKQTGQMLATISQYAGLVVTPRWSKTVFKHLEFLPLSGGRLLAIFVSQDGMVENRILETTDNFNYRDLEKINNYCNASFVGLSLEDARKKVAIELQQAEFEYDRLLSNALLFSRELFQDIGESDLVVEGESRLLDSPAFSNVESIREILRILEEKQKLLNILDTSVKSPGVKIFIGSDAEEGGVRNVSMITATYGSKTQVLGTLGVIGPTHLDYSRVIPMVDFTAKLVSQLMTEGENLR